MNKFIFFYTFSFFQVESKHCIHSFCDDVPNPNDPFGSKITVCPKACCYDETHCNHCDPTGTTPALISLRFYVQFTNSLALLFSFSLFHTVYNYNT